MAKNDCLFCGIVRGDIPAKILWEDDDFIAFEDIDPKAPVHILVIPREHIEKMSDLTDRNAGMAGRLLLAANRMARVKGIQESGYRVVLNCNRDAGQAVPHLHLHLLGGRKLSWPPG